MIILDTNVLSELLRPRPEPAVIAWLEAEALDDAWICSMTVAEMLFGVLRLPDGRRKQALHEAVMAIFENEFHGRILAFDARCAAHLAIIRLRRTLAGRPVSTEDAIIAATARAHDAIVATRNVKDFTGCGIETVNPWG